MPTAYDVSFTVPLMFTISTVVSAIIVLMTKHDVIRAIFGFIALVSFAISVIGGSSQVSRLQGIKQNLLNDLRNSKEELKIQRSKAEERQARINELTQYQGAYEQVVKAVLAPSSDEGGEDLATLQTVILEIPASFPAAKVTGYCQDQGRVKRAIDPLVADGSIAAGQRPAWNALMNCAFVNTVPPPPSE